MHFNIKKLIHGALLFATVLLLTACPHISSFYIRGTVTGLTGSGLTSSLVLQNNGGDNLTVSANGPFTFPTEVTSCGAIGKANCGAFNITVLTQPIGQICTVIGGSGTATSTVTGVVVTCGNAAAPRFAYVANGGGDISEYTINSDGTLTTMATPTIGAGSRPFSVTADPSGKYLYVANSGDNTVSQYTINSDGTLTAIPPTTVAGVNQNSTGKNPNSITVDPSSQYVYVANEGDNTVSQYIIGTGGALTQMSPATVGAGTNPYSVTVDPLGKYVYVANEGSNDISQFNIGTGGVLTPMSPATVGTGLNPYSVTVDHSGLYVYVANEGDNTISQYTIDTGGALTAMPAGLVAAGINPVSVTITNSGQYAYVANYGSNTVSQYAIVNGALTAMSIPAVPAGTSPYSITVDPSSQYVYVANKGSNNVSLYTIGTTTGGAIGTTTGGELSPITSQTTIGAGTAPVSIITAQ
jgi:YVTN family beta-propeller protein